MRPAIFEDSLGMKALVRSTIATALVAVAAAAAPAPALAAEEFGFEKFESEFVTEAGEPVVLQAGSHPYAVKTTLVFNHRSSTKQGVKVELDGGEPKNLEANLPAGVVFNPQATISKCSERVLEETSGCPVSSQVGWDTWELGAVLGGVSGTSPIYNMEPPGGTTAAFGVPLGQISNGLVLHMIGKLRTGSDYGFTGEVPDITQNVELFGNTIELWGAGHEASLAKPFITLPTSCGGPLTATVSADMWEDPSAPPAETSSTSSDAEGRPVAVTGCRKIGFNPQVSAQVTNHAADSPTGLSVELKVPQEEVGGLAEANLKEAVLTLPAGMSVSPSAADGGLGACPLTTGKEPQKEERELKHEEAGIDLESSAPADCPDSAKVGSVEIETPLLAAPLVGSIYLARQATPPFPPNGNPFGSLVALYLVAEGNGAVVKIPGEVRLNPATGQLTAAFGQDPVRTAATGVPQFLPQLPFSRMRLEIFGGPRAALTTPEGCGSYTVTSELTPYSAPESGPPATPSSTFQIDERCGGGRFNPTFNAETTNNEAGAFSPFVLTGFREDTEQNISRIQVSTPPGLLGSISGVPLCEEPQAEKGDCGQASLIGHVTVGVGVGPDLLYVTGEAFLTGPYNGAPFGLSVKVPAVAGPFYLGTVVVRAAIDIDPNTAALTVTSEPMPQFLDGIPLQVRALQVSVDRERFMFNPTDCEPLSISATMTGALGASAALSQRFQATDCAALAFKPKFTLSSSGRTSRTGGASLDAKVSFPAGSGRTEANFASAKVELPRQLPARLTALRNACPGAVFEANPAACPAASVVGIARASTPILPGEMTGPVYFVSHGGKVLPALVVVLEGYGVRVDLAAATAISKKNITSLAFKSLPDVPVASFELYSPQGPDSALAATGNLCGSRLAMPTTFTAQNGAVVKQSTKIAVTGCAKAKRRAKGAKRAKRSSGASAARPARSPR